MTDNTDLLTDMRMQVSYTDKATMPIPLYERMKSEIQELHDKLKESEKPRIYGRGKR